MSIKGKLAIVMLSAALAFYAIVGGFLSVQKDVFAKGDPYVQLRIFGEVLRHIVRDYVDEPDLEKVRVGALRGLTEGLDPYSAYLTPEQAKKFQASHTDQPGSGMILSKVAGYIYVVSVIKGSPAEKSGLRSGDFIEYIDNIATRDISLYDAEEMLTGSGAPEADLKIFRRGRPYKAKFKLSVITQPAIESSILEPGVGYIHITTLSDGKADDVKKAVLDLQKKGAQKLVLDLRGAANGRIEAGVEVANFFIKSGTLAKAIGHSGAVTNSYEADASKVIFNGPLNLVVDKSTASAGEVIAAAVLANKRGELVGERTFGAGSEQKIFELKGGAAMLLTVVKYADPSGSPFMKETAGIAPSVEVKAANINDEALPEDSEQTTQDGQGKEEEAQLPIEQPLAAADDIQLKKAVELLKTNNEKRVAQNEATSAAATPDSASPAVPERPRSARAAARL